MKRRKVSHRVRQICQVLDEFGPMGNAAIRRRLPDMLPGNLHASCAIAHDLGLVTITKGEGLTRNGFSVYHVVDGWKSIIDRLDPPETKELSPWAFSCTPFAFGVQAHQSDYWDNSRVIDGWIDTREFQESQLALPLE